MPDTTVLDPVLAALALRKEKKGFDWFFALAAVAVFAFSLYMYIWQYQFPFTDLAVHTRIAGEFDFTD